MVVCENDRSKRMEKDDRTPSIGFEQALILAGLGKYTYRVLWISLFSLLCAGMELSLSLITASAQCDLKLDVYKKGMIGSVPMLGIVASAHVWGFLADTKGRKYCLVLSMCGTFVFATLASFTNHWTLLALFKFFSTACSAGTNSVTFTILGEVTPKSHRSRFLQYVGVMMIAQAISALLAYPIQLLDLNVTIPLLNLKYRPWRMLAQSFALFSLFDTFVTKIFLMESPKYYFARGMDKKGLDILKKMYALNTGNSPDDYMPKKIFLDESEKASQERCNIVITIWRQTIPLFHKKHLMSTILVSYICAVIYSLAPPFVMWFPLILGYYTHNLNTTHSFCELIEREAAHTHSFTFDDNTTIIEIAPCIDSLSNFTLIAVAIVALYFTFATMVSVVIVKFTGRKWFLVGIHLICTALALAVNYVRSVYAIFVFMGSLTTLVCMGISATYAVELFPTYLRAMAVCLTIMIGRAFSFGMTIIIGPQLETNCSNLMFMTAAFIFSGSIAGLFLPGKPKKVEEPIEYNAYQHRHSAISL